jgi:hypothetical protein|tara:strand:- start:606 stop:893 length:288 start_codon:yes stop_codon:yes gene_type:complete
MSSDKPYCGKKTKPPKGRSVGTPNYCYKSGIRSGYFAGVTKPLILTNEQIDKLSGDAAKALAGSYKLAGYRNKSVSENKRNLKNLQNVNIKNLFN